ncbi:MAG TPA: YifB family Mg chelatase-like AAA ATPase [Patescibacteria group bacterium]|nr:YifB family Mg chelatase-like AAA ATPase [Patescibacteria group bacterium]
MSLAKVFSAAVVGLEAYPVEVEVDISNGLPSFTIVGLPDKAIEESKERVRSAIKNSGANFPMKRITVNLAPADIKKEGPAYDLAIALGILAADEQIPQIDENLLLTGELALNGSLRHINGVLPMASALAANFKEIILPEINRDEATLVKNLEIRPAKNLKELIFYFKKEKNLPTYYKKFKIQAATESADDFCHIKGQEQAKRALEIAASGDHNVFFSGPPGAGKTLLARTFPTILPTMNHQEILEVTKIYSVAGLLPHSEPLVSCRPFRAPHHTTSSVALVGGGTYPRPGEITLSHRGVLFMDEFAEFPRSVLEALRQPLEDGIITVSRAQGSLQFPAKFILIAAQNPCPCGYLGDPVKSCICTPYQIIRYQKRVSGPLLDRIDIHLEVPRVKYEKLADETLAEASLKIRERVEKARKVQLKRLGKTNAEMTNKELKIYCRLNEITKKLLRNAVEQFHLSARQFTRVLKVSRTIADLAESEKIASAHLAEALQYRPKEQTMY